MSLAGPRRMCASQLFILIWYDIRLICQCATASDYQRIQATALVHVGTLNRKSRPSKSLGDPLCELMKNFKDLIQEFGQFSEYVSAFTRTRFSADKPVRF